MSDPIVGIDLGTTNSVVAALVDGEPQVLADDKSFKIQPSVVSFHPNGSVLVGAEAKQRRIIDPRNTVYSAKRLIGRTFESKEVAAASMRMPYAIKEGVNQQPVITTRGGEFAVPEISAIVLDHMRSIARKALRTDVGRAVITVPANFTDAQRSATATAGAIAGLTVVRVLNEPTAAALAYGRGRNVNQTIAVYDFGGGTFDVTLLRLHDEVYEVLSTAGDTFLGGDDIDERLVDHMVQHFLRETRTDLRSDELALQRLRAVAEQTKIELSRRSRAIVKVDEIAYGPGGTPLDLTIEVARDEFVTQIADLVERTFPVCQEAMQTAGLDRVDEVILVGGTTKMPFVRERVTAFFGKPPRTDVNPDEAVAVGAAIQADALAAVLRGGKRPTTRSAVAPPAPPMEVKPAGSGPMPPPPPAEAIARKLAPGPRHTSPRVATTAQRVAQPPPRHVLLDDEEPTGIRPRPPAGDEEPTGVLDRPPAGDEEPTGIRPRPMTARSTQPGTAAAPPPMPAQVPKLSAQTIQGVALGRIGRPDTGSDVVEKVRRAEPRDLSAPAAQDDAAAFDEQATGLIDFRDPTVTELEENTGDIPTDVRPQPGDAPTQVETSPGPTQVDAPPVAPAPPPAAKAPAPPPSAAEASLDLLRDLLPDSAAAQSISAPAPAAPVVLDVVPQSLGIGTVAGFCEELIHRNAHVPCEHTRKFTTSSDYQTRVNIRICQGESRRIAENAILGEVVLADLPQAPRGQPSIAVTFRIDESGMLQVSALDEASGDERSVSLNLLGQQTSAEIEAAKQRFQRLKVE